MELTYLFQFCGLSKRHHVFRADIPRDASAEARNEISRRRWFNPVKISTLVASIPTREIVSLFRAFENRAEALQAVIENPDRRVNGTAQLHADVLSMTCSIRNPLPRRICCTGDLTVVHPILRRSKWLPGRHDRPSMAPDDCIFVAGYCLMH
jgi:hypothetical protein